MRTIRQLCAATFLTLILTISAFAGDMSCPGVTSPPPDQQQTSAAGEMQTPSITTTPQQTSATGEIQFPGVTAAEIALTLMVNVLSVF